MVVLNNDVLVHLVAHFLDLREAVLLIQACPALWRSVSETRWQRVLAAFGLGRPNGYQHLTWRHLACGIVSHRDQCGACASYMLRRRVLPSGIKVLTRAEAMQDLQLAVLPGLALPDDGPEAQQGHSPVVYCYSRTPLIKLYEGQLWEDRAKLSPELVAKAMSARSTLTRDSLREHERSDSAHGLLDLSAPMWRLSRHPLLASLLALSKSVSSIRVATGAAGHLLEQFPNGFELVRLDNTKGITALDLARDIAERHPPRQPNQACPCGDERTLCGPHSRARRGYRTAE